MSLDICAKFGIPNSPQSPDIGQNSSEGISDFRISLSILYITENCHNSRANHDIDMKLGTVTKPNKRNMVTSKKLTMTMSTNYDVIVIFPIYGQIGAIRKPDSGRMVCKT